jgi:hypothetical protein
MFATRDVVDWTGSYKYIHGISFEADYPPQEKAVVQAMERQLWKISPFEIVITNTGSFAISASTWVRPLLYQIVMGEGGLYSDNNIPVYYAKVTGPFVTVAPSESDVQLYVPGGDFVSKVPGTGYVTGTGHVMTTMPIAVQTVVDGRVQETRLEVGPALFAHSAVRVHGVTYGVRERMLMDDRGVVVDDRPMSENAYVYWSNFAQRLVMRDVQQVRLYRPLHVRFAWVAACVL